MNDLLDPKNDFVFKRIFGSEENKDVLLTFLNTTFVEAGEPPLTEIILMNPYTDKDSPRDKQSIVDIKAKTTEGELINIEMQLFNQYDRKANIVLLEQTILWATGRRATIPSVEEVCDN